MSSENSKENVKHSGGCHCGAVRWEVFAPAEIEAYDCNCSICMKKQNRHFIVAKSLFTLLKGEDMLTTYQCNTKVAKHPFCKVCGVQSFYVPRSNPDSYGIMPHCIDSNTIEKLTFKTFDGQNWETTMKTQAPVALGSSTD
uniref:CENP-V/GFA domain-containing protein n=1 Tax=Plectus sambesii TaxID=2011161 RepID=A0A914WRF0_9BILA